MGVANQIAEQEYKASTALGGLNEFQLLLLLLASASQASSSRRLRRRQIRFRTRRVHAAQKGKVYSEREPWELSIWAAINKKYTTVLFYFFSLRLVFLQVGLAQERKRRPFLILLLLYIQSSRCVCVGLCLDFPLANKLAAPRFPQ